MDTRSDKDKEFDKAQAVDRLSQDDKDKMSLIRMMMAKEKESMKESDEDKKHLDMIAYYEFGADGFDKLGDTEKEEARKFMADKKSVKEADIEDYELEDEDMDNPDEDLVIIGSGYLDIKNKFKGRPNMTNGELATIGQKVVDKLHKGDKDAAIDYIMSKINENDKKIEEMIPTTPGKIELGDDGEPHVTVMSNAKRKEAMRSVLDILKKELDVETDDAFTFIKTHRDELFDGTVNPFDKDEVVDEYNEFLSVNTEYVREEDGKNLNPGNPPANFKSPNEEGDEAVGRESASGAFEESKNWRGETLKEQFKRLSK
mgnify:FL=1